jgi:hypothetical protein
LPAHKTVHVMAVVGTLVRCNFSLANTVGAQGEVSCVGRRDFQVGQDPRALAVSDFGGDGPDVAAPEGDGRPAAGEEGDGMTRGTRLRGQWRGGLLIVWLLATLAPGAWAGAEVAPPSPGLSEPPADFILTAHEGRLSLRAQDASLKAIVEAIGRQLFIDVVTRIPADEQVTLAFEQLSLAEALKRLRPYVNYLVLEDAATTPGTIRQLIVVSKRLAGGPASRPTPDSEGVASPAPSPSDAPTPTDTARPKPFRFEFDPTTGGGRGR